VREEIRCIKEKNIRTVSGRFAQSFEGDPVQQQYSASLAFAPG
jgi:hypothetical protein